MFSRTIKYLTLVIQVVNTFLNPQMKAHTLENVLELKKCFPYYPHISEYDISAYKSLNMPFKTFRTMGHLGFRSLPLLQNVDLCKVDPWDVGNPTLGVIRSISCCTLVILGVYLRHIRNFEKNRFFP